MIRKQLIPESQNISIPVPENYIGKKMEVLIYAIDELIVEENSSKKQAINFRGKLNLSTEQYEDLQNHLGNIRKEWNDEI